MLTAALSPLLFIHRAGDVFIWTSGSVNYLWSAVIMMFAMWLIDKCFEDITLKKVLLMSIPVAISAATNETTGGMLIVFMILTFIVKKKKFSPLYLIPVIAALPGMALVILAPGNSVRAQNVEHVELMTMATIIKSARSYLKGMLDYFLYFMLVTAFAFLVRATDVTRQFKGKEYLKQMFYLIVSYRFFIMGFIGTMALCATSYTARPLMFGGTLFIIEAGAAFIDIINTLSKRQSRFKLTAAEAGCLLLAVGLKPAILCIGYKKAILTAAVIFVILCAVSYAIRRFANHTENIQSVNASAKNTSVAIAGTIVMATLAIVLAVGTAKNVISYNDNIGRLKNYLNEVTACLEEKGLEESRKLYYKPYEERSVFIPYLFEHSPTRYSLSLYSLKWYELCLSVNDT